MRINSNDLLMQGIEKAIYLNQNQRMSDVLNEKDEKPVKITISEVGLRTYGQSMREKAVQEKLENRELAKLQDLWDSGVRLSPIPTYRFHWVGSGTYTSLEENAKNLLTQYANYYDEIVRSYEDGTRVINIQDDDMESGYRTLTMEEELEELNKSYNQSVEFLENSERMSRDFMKNFEKSILSNPLFKSSKLAQTYNEDEYLKRKEETEIELEIIIPNLLKAASQFTKQYSVNDHHETYLKSLLENIKIF